MLYGFDEAHCISKWGDKFRKVYSDVGKLRSLFPPAVPFLAVSATLPPHVLAQVQDILGCSKDDTMFVNLGNNRPNITTIVSRMRGAATDLNALNFVVDKVRVSSVVLTVKKVLDSKKRVKPAKNRVEEIHPVKQVQVHASGLLQAVQPRDCQLVTHQIRSISASSFCRSGE